MIVSLTDLKKFLDITDETKDAELYRLLKQAQSFAEQYCKFAFDSAERTEYYEGSGSNRLLLKHRPVTAIDSVFQDWDREFGASTEIDSDEIDFDADAGILILDETTLSCVAGKKTVKVIYTAGWTKETAPDALKQAIVKLAGANYSEGNTSVSSSGSVNVESQTNEDLRDQAMDELEMFRALSI